MSEENKDDKTTSDDEVKNKFKTWINEVFDEREAKAAAEREAEKKEDEKPENKRTAEKPSIIQSLFGG